jgi:hypothetical protein
MRWAGHVARMGKRNVYRILVGKPEEKKPLERPRRKWMDNMKMNLRETGKSRGPGFDSRRYPIFWEVVGLERGPLNLVRIIEESLEGKVAAPV